MTESKGGAGVEAWLLRIIVMTVVALGLAAVVASRDDIQRYYRIRQM